MQEDFLHYIWQYQKMTTTALQTESGKLLQIVKVGMHNQHSGPDFFNAQLIIGNQKWAGNVEIHLQSSDWYAHHHEQDKAYENIILHVVWEDDVAVFHANNTPIETLVLQKYVDETLIHSYKKLMQNKSWIPCEARIGEIDGFTWGFWKEKLIINRLQRKALHLTVILERLNNNWEAVLFELLAQNFGLKINQQSFLQVAEQISFSVFKKEISRQLSLEALLFGQANMLPLNMEDSYGKALQEEYRYLQQKYHLKENTIKVNFYGLRPAGFPTLRLSQLASLYHQNQSLFAKVIEIQSFEDAQQIFSVSASEYWSRHYTFGKESALREKKLTAAFVQLLVINVVLPVQYLYTKHIGKDSFESILEMYTTLSPEKNNIIKKFQKLKVPILTALDSQAVIELKNELCDHKKCLQCQIGSHLLYSKPK